MPDPSVAVVIVAAGRGHRLGGEIPKQFLPLAGPCAYRRAIEAFIAIPSVRWIVPVIHSDDSTLSDEALAGLQTPLLRAPVTGGETRALSVRNGLDALADDAPDLVLIHDAARPFVPCHVIEDVIAALATSDGALAALPLVDALWREEDGCAATPVPRDGLWRAQTPQGFDFTKIRAAHHAHDGAGADDVAVAREAGLLVKLVPGDEINFKITTLEDLMRAREHAELHPRPLPRTVSI